MIKKLDRYIIKQFLGTYFLSMILMLSICVVIDISEKIDDFIGNNVPVSEIIFDYYINFIIFFSGLLSPLFIFISVVYFTSNLASKTEIIAVLAGGISYKRFLVPYFLTASFLGALTFYADNFLIPKANQQRLAFENRYLNSEVEFNEKNFHRQIAPNTYAYFETYNRHTQTAHRFSLEKIENAKLTDKIIADYAQYNETDSLWKLFYYQKREIVKDSENIVSGYQLDTLIALNPSDLLRRDEIIEQMNFFELNQFIKEEWFKGNANINSYELEKYRRSASPFAALILTLMGVCIASRKVRGGVGINIGLGIALSFSFILLFQMTKTFSIKASLDPLIAMWIPNILYTFLTIYLYQKAQK